MYVYILVHVYAHWGLCQIGWYLLYKELYSHTAMQVYTQTYNYVFHNNQNVQTRKLEEDTFCIKSKSYTESVL